MIRTRIQKFTSNLTVAATAVASLLIFAWPLYISAENSSEANLAQAVFMALMPILVIMILVEFGSGRIGTKQLAILGVLIALNAVVRMLGAGTGGIETAFFLILVGAYVFGSGFGFVLGAGSLLVSALLTAGFGPWLPFQMMAAGLLGIGAGLLPRAKRIQVQIAWLVCWGILGSYIYGALMTLWNWPFLAAAGSSIGYLPGEGLIENLTRFVQYELLTGGLLWDTGRAITTTILLLVTAPALLATLRRAASRAGIERDL